jgi:uncharacterized OB-fold protein
MTNPLPNIQTKEGQEQLRQMGIRVIPQPDEVSSPYWEAARRHELLIQRCGSCSAYQHPPAVSCRCCQDTDLQWTQISGRGTVYTFVIVHRLMVPGFDEPYVVAQIRPEETADDMVRIATNIKECDVHDVRIGMAVEVFFEEVTGNITLPQFRPVRSKP